MTVQLWVTDLLSAVTDSIVYLRSNMSNKAFLTEIFQLSQLTKEALTVELPFLTEQFFESFVLINIAALNSVSVQIDKFPISGGAMKIAILQWYYSYRRGLSTDHPEKPNTCPSSLRPKCVKRFGTYHYNKQPTSANLMRSALVGC
jgi:hypothetical protein